MIGTSSVRGQLRPRHHHNADEQAQDGGHLIGAAWDKKPSD
jgi:hypothetical protein